MSNSGEERVVLINCTDDDDEELSNERLRPSRLRVICTRFCVVCYYVLCPFIFIIRVLNLSMDCCNDCLKDCCGTCCCECSRACGRALCGSCIRGVRSLGRYGHDFCSICGEMGHSLKRMTESWHDV